MERGKTLAARMMNVKTSSVIGILMMVVGCSGQLGALTAAESNVTQDGSVLDSGATTDALSPNPCTAVALVAPTGGFAGQVGVAQPLSASATCPAGQVPEYQFWGKRSTDSNWTVLGSGYNAGSSSYTPVATDAGGYCYSVVVRAVGATENYQARSGATCGTISTATTQPPADRFLQVAGGAFQFIGTTDGVTQVFVAQVFSEADGDTITSGSVAVQCAGPGGGYFIPCTRLRETGTFACGHAVACGTSASAELPIPAPFVVGPTAHIDVAFFGVAPTLVPTTATTAVLTVH